MHARRFLAVAAATAITVGVAGPAVAQASTPSAAAPVPVVVRGEPGAGGAAQQAVVHLGGSVGRDLKLIDGFTASVPADRLGALRAVPGVAQVTEDAGLTLSDADVTGQVSQTGSLYTLANKVTGAAALWDRGATGQGVDIALLDSGVAPVKGLDGADKVVYGPDLTPESTTPAKDLDSYGHGTHMAGILAGRDAGVMSYSGNTADFVGMAPGARVVSVKIADAQGRTDVSQAIAAIDWVVGHAHTDGLNIRVVNLSFGTDGAQKYVLDPLAYAAEQAWHSGIVVVVAAGNQGNGKHKLSNPASDPYLLAVGSEDANGTPSTADDTISSFSNGGDSVRDPDVVAPGDHVVSLRDAGSFLDQNYPAARIGDRLFRGSGTSQAAAVVSGGAALLISQRPDLTPDQVKTLLTGTAQKIKGVPGDLQGKGAIDLAAAADAPTPANALQRYKRATGLGSLELARGSVHVTVNGKQLTGEVDVQGRAFNAAAVAKGLEAEASRTARTTRSEQKAVREDADRQDSVHEHSAKASPRHPSSEQGTSALTGVTWSGVTWSGVTWSGVTWSGVTWSGVTWSGVTWSGVTWSGVTWSGVTWSGVTWSGSDWA